MTLGAGPLLPLSGQRGLADPRAGGRWWTAVVEGVAIAATRGLVATSLVLAMVGTTRWLAVIANVRTVGVAARGRALPRAGGSHKKESSYGNDLFSVVDTHLVEKEHGTCANKIGKGRLQGYDGKLHAIDLG